MQADFAPLFSGSSGNSVYVRLGETRLLVDAGVSASRVTGALEALGVSPDSLDAILVTHEHTDHAQGVGVLSRRYHLPVYATQGTWNGMCAKIGRVAPENRRVVTDDHDFFIGCASVTPFVIPHDAAEPVGYAFAAPGFRVAVATDLGHLSEDWLRPLYGSDVVLLEANHDPDMLAAGRYPYELKRRIRGQFGHLANEQAGEAALRLVKEGVRQIILGHLSAENNFPELAWRTVADALDAAGIAPGEDVGLTVARRDGAEAVYHLESGEAAYAAL